MLPGKKDELELDWVPKGHNETIDKYLKTIPSDQLPVKGSQAAQDRKQQLQKQIPIHDIDPALCHELTEDELNKMNEYIAHVKQSSVGVGQIVSLSSIIKGNLHMLNPQEAAIIASRYAKGIPLSEIVKLQSQSRAELLKQHGLQENLQKLSMNEPSSNQNAVGHQKVYDKNNPGYVDNDSQLHVDPHYSNPLEPNRRNPSAFVPYNTSSISKPGGLYNNSQSSQQPQYAYTLPHLAKNIPEKLNILGQNSDTVNTNNPNYASVLPHMAKTISRGVTPQETFSEDISMQNPNYTNQFRSISKGLNPNEQMQGTNQLSRDALHDPTRHALKNVTYEPLYQEDIILGDPKYANSPNNVHTEHGSRTFTDPSTGKDVRGHDAEQVIYSDILHPDAHMKQANSGYLQSETGESTGNLIRPNKPLPNYSPGKHNIYQDQQLPRTLPKNVKDLAFSTYDPTNLTAGEMQKDRYQELRLPEDPYLANQNVTKQIIHGIPKPVVGENLFSDRGLKPPNIPQPPIPGQNSSEHWPSKDIRDDHGYPAQKETGAHQNYSVGGQDASYPDQREIGAHPNYLDGRKDALYKNPTVPQQHIPGQKSSGHHPTHGVREDHPSYSGGRQDAFYPGQREIGANPISSRGGQDHFYPGQKEIEPYANYSDERKGVSYPAQTSYPEMISGQQLSKLHPSNIKEDYSHPKQGEMGINMGKKPGRSVPGKKLSELYPSNFDINEDYLHPSQVEIGGIQDIDYPEIKAATHGTNDFYEDYSPDSIREILNNIKLPDCHYCKKPFEENEFAVTIDRANVLFHAECFRCAGCNQILADNVYFYNKETDNIYCGRDYAKVRGFPRCKACDELIFTKEYCLAENATFHLKHFCCYECDTPLAGQDYVLEDEMPYCIPCFEQSKANKCSTCERVIKPDETGCALKGIHFHATDDCFSCKVCRKPLMGQKFLLKNEKLYCSHQCFGVDS